MKLACLQQLSWGIILFVSGFTLWGASLQKDTQAATEKSWTKSSGDFKVQVSATELKAIKISSGKVVFSASELTQQGFDDYKETLKGEKLGHCTYSRTFRPVSLLNNFLTFSDELLSSCVREAHPSSSYRVTTIDLSNAETVHYASSPDDALVLTDKTSKNVRSLTSFFKQQDILHAMQQDSVLKQNLSPFPASLAEIPTSIDSNGMEIPKTPCRFTLSPDYLSRFVLHHLVGPNVAVRVELAPIGGACRSAKAELGLLLPIPAQMHTALDSAGSLRDGFLAKDAPPQIVKAQIQRSVDTGNPKQ